MLPSPVYKTKKKQVGESDSWIVHWDLPYVLKSRPLATFYCHESQSTLEVLVTFSEINQVSTYWLFPDLWEGMSEFQFPGKHGLDPSRKVGESGLSQSWWNEMVY